MGSFRCAGSDRFFHIENIAKLKSQTIPISAVLSAQSVPRLEKISEAFQRIKYVNLKFRVVPCVSTATSGGYVCAFIADVADHVPNTDFGLSKLTSQGGAQTKKWWETATVPAALSGDLLYTSFSPQDPRLSSPGKFVLGVDGVASQDGSLTVYLDWEVVLSVPSLEGTEAEEPKNPSLSISLWTKGGSKGLYALQTPGKYDTLSQDARKLFVDPLPSTMFRLSSVRGFVENASNLAGQFRAFSKVFIDSDYNMWPWNIEDTKMENLSFGHTLIAAQGENVEWIDKDPNVKGFQRGSEFLCHVPAWMPCPSSPDVSLENSISSPPYRTDRSQFLSELLSHLKERNLLETEISSALSLIHI